MADFYITYRLPAALDALHEVTPVRLRVIIRALLLSRLQIRILFGDQPVKFAIDKQSALRAMKKDAVRLVEHGLSIELTVLVSRDEASRILESNLQCIRCLPVVFDKILSTQRRDCGGRHFVERHLNDIEQVNTPIRHHAARVIPKPAEMG